MAGAGGILAPIALGVLRQVVRQAGKTLRKKVSAITKSSNEHLVPVGLSPRNPATPLGRPQPVFRAAAFRQQKRFLSRWAATTQSQVGTTVRRFLTTLSEQASGKSSRTNTTRFAAASSITRLAAQTAGQTPFAHTLRPNLTGGTIPRSASGYGISGGSARYFSHAPAAPAQVVQNVSQAMRAFWLSGQHARFEGLDSKGRKQYRAVSALEDETARKMASFPRTHPGSYVDFGLSPTITAMSPLASAFPIAGAAGMEEQRLEEDMGINGFIPTAYTYAARLQQNKLLSRAAPTSLNAPGFLEELTTDFNRALRDLAATMSDIERLARLGDLAVSLVTNAHAPTLRVAFPGVDAETLEKLCQDLGVTRGLVGQDTGFDSNVGAPVALRFPFAPGEEGVVPDEEELTSPGGSLRSLEGHEIEEGTEWDGMSEVESAFFIEGDEDGGIPWVLASTPGNGSQEEGYGSLVSLSPPVGGIGHAGGSLAQRNFQGVEGIYRFIEECDRAKARI